MQAGRPCYHGEGGGSNHTCPIHAHLNAFRYKLDNRAIVVKKAGEKGGGGGPPPHPSSRGPLGGGPPMTAVPPPPGERLCACVYVYMLSVWLYYGRRTQIN